MRHKKNTSVSSKLETGVFYYDQKSQFIFIRNDVILHQDEECSQIKQAHYGDLRHQKCAIDKN